MKKAIYFKEFLQFYYIFEKAWRIADGADIYYDIPVYPKCTKRTTTNGDNFLTVIFFDENFAEKSYKMDIYKSPQKVYNIVPSKEPIRVGTLFSCTTCVFSAKYQSYDIEPQ